MLFFFFFARRTCSKLTLQLHLSSFTLSAPTLAVSHTRLKSSRLFKLYVLSSSWLTTSS